MIIKNNKSSQDFLSYMFSLLLFALYLPQAVANNINLTALIDLGDTYKEDVFWHKPSVNPKNNQQYYIANTTGKFHLIDDQKVVKTPILNIPNYYLEFVKLSAVVLHPNFSFNQQKGYNTFYTAHVELADQSIRTLRIKDKNLEHSFPYEAVIVEWKLNEANSLKVDPDSQREILRIGINSPENSVIEMRFNPYIKSWHDNFSHMYIALAYDETLRESPLYSGAILRINPEKFGLRSYTTPNNNPFINQADVPDELLIIGIQQLMQFVWQKNNDQQLILAHRFNQQVLLSLVNYGDILSNTEPEHTLLRGASQLAEDSLVFYRGREFKASRNKVLFMSQNDGYWQLQSIDTSPPFQKSVINVFSGNDLAPNDQISILTDENDELLIFSRAHHVIQQLVNNTPKGETTADEYLFNEPENQANDSSISSYIFWVVVVFGIIIAWFAKSKKSQQTVKSLLHRNYARFELSADNKQLSLFHRHQQDAALTLDVSSIVRSDVLLNDEVLLSIEADVSGFNEQLEQMLENKFIDEKRIKMVDDRTRKLAVNLTDDKGTVYSVFLYFREGNQRLTKAKFGQITDEIKEWCWFISAQLSPDKTGKRIVEIVQPKIVKTQPSVNKPTVNIPESTAKVEGTEYLNVDHESNNKVKLDSDKNTKNIQTVPSNKETKVINKKTQNTDSSNIDTQLIEALNKLANLKAKGFLTEDEFISAKAKILANLQNE
ncbi:SHOCT domain-containing protein [Thalassotalea profundi]|uniref:SHOCT domain-containing protein n=1 Tax=Thalassotalea profundi TaxID=2036687 RepID=A0ABQ3IP88_9GAMM|nr:SHOCT domain-containing protein [Thalassotalea profundi]GHE88507.1 hypothetical protein GCM10011501_17400 [Thalassotalea profundi]